MVDNKHEDMILEVNVINVAPELRICMECISTQV